MAGYMFKIESPGRDGAAPTTHMVLAIGRGEEGARVALSQTFKLRGDERVTSLLVDDKLVEFMDLHDGDAHLWKR